MGDSLTLDQVNNAINAGVTGHIDGGWNGSVGNVNLAKPRDYTGDFGKICATQNNFNMPETLCYLLWVIQGKPARAVALTQEHINTAVPHYRRMIARYRIYKIFKDAGVDFVYRQSDLIGTDYTGAAAKPGNATRELYTLLTAEGVMEEKLAEQGRMVLLSLVANAIHREQHADHSWFTDEMKNPRSPTTKILTIAGADKDKFKTYMEECGHDGNHHLDFVTISTLAKVLARTATRVMPDVADYMVGGDNLKGKELGAYFDLGEANKERFPAGILGKAALLVAVQMIEAMITNLASRVKMEGIAGITVNAARLGDRISSTALVHKVILELGRCLGPLISLVYGFCTKARILDENEYKAFENHAKRYPAKLAVGRSLATSLARTTPHQEAITGAVISALSSINEGLMAAAATKVDVGGRAVDLLANKVPVDTARIKAEVGKVGGGGPAGGTMFYDAEEP
jgi:hypothetical protein